MRFSVLFVLLVTLVNVSYASLIERLNWEIQKGADEVKRFAEMNLGPQSTETVQNEVQNYLNEAHEHIQKKSKEVLSSVLLAGEDMQNKREELLADGHQALSDFLKKF